MFMREGKQAQETLTESIPLENGLTLNIFDGSCRLTGDRWRVRLAARIDIPLDRIDSNDDTPDPYPSDLRTVLGEGLVFEQNRERNFIDDRLRRSVFQELRDSLVSGLVAYVSRPDFARRFILKAYNERLTRNAWYKDLPEDE
jgi:hypothetical protein